MIFSALKGIVKKKTTRRRKSSSSSNSSSSSSGSSSSGSTCSTCSSYSSVSRSSRSRSSSSSSYTSSSSSGSSRTSRSSGSSSSSSSRSSGSSVIRRSRSVNRKKKSKDKLKRNPPLKRKLSTDSMRNDEKIHVSKKKLNISPLKSEQYRNKSKLLESKLRKERLQQLSNNNSPCKDFKDEKLKPAEVIQEINEFKDIKTEQSVPVTVQPLIEIPKIELDADEIALFDSLITKELDPNGGATILVAYQDELNTKLTLPNRDFNQLMEKFSYYFLNCVYSESKSNNINDLSDEVNLKENKGSRSIGFGYGLHDSTANYVLGIVRNSASTIPDLLDYFSEKYPQMIVKTSLLINSNEIDTLKISEYRKNAYSSYLNGTFRYGPMLQTSIVGVRNEEIGDYFPDFIEKYLEGNLFLKHVMPWGDMSKYMNMSPMNSDDGPIIWVRPGEQMIPTSNLKDNQFNTNNNANNSTSNSNSCNNNNLNSGDVKKRRKLIDSLRLSSFYAGRSSNPREILFEDRTKAHVDNVGNGLETTAAVGVLKAVHGPNGAGGSKPNRIVKDVVCFHAQDYERVIELLKLDIFEPPVSQVILKFHKLKIHLE